MEQAINLSEIRRLSIPERIFLVQEIWDSIASDKENFELTEEQRNELDKRVDNYYLSPDEGCSWEEVKKRLKKFKQ